jgi:hypothetical protein
MRFIFWKKSTQNLPGGSPAPTSAGTITDLREMLQNLVETQVREGHGNARSLSQVILCQPHLVEEAKDVCIRNFAVHVSPPFG